MNYKTLFFILTFLTTTLNGEPVTKWSTLTSVYQNTIQWAKDNPRKATIAISLTLAPIVLTYGYCFHYNDILAFIGSLSYRAVETTADVSTAAMDGALNAATDSIMKDPKLVAKLGLLGLSYQAIFYGIPFLLTNYVKFKFGVK